MSIQSFCIQLKCVIAGKEAFMDSIANMQVDKSNEFAMEVLRELTIDNINELKNILAEVEACCE